MCVIIDANVASLVFPKPPATAHPDYQPLLQWLYKKDGILVFGGKNGRELNQVGTAAKALVELRRATRAKEIQGVDEEQKLVEQTGLCVSDDPHVIALARRSGARTLCSEDEDLHKDFKNRSLVPGPSGGIYQDARHRNLLRHTLGCQAPRKR
jgi:hypothetical protein